MNRALEWLDHASVVWWNYIVHTSWQAAVAGAVLLLAVNLWGRRWPAPLRYALLVLALLKFACPPLLPVPTGLFTRLISPRLTLPTVPERRPTQASASSLSDTRPIHAAVVSPVLGPAPSVRWTSWLMLLHGMGTGVVLVWIGQQAVRLRAVTRSSHVFRGGALYRDLVLQLNLKRIPRLVVSDQVATPMAFGFQKPAILLPASLAERLSPGELKAVLAHELAHCQRGDLWLNWLQLMLLAVWWFHPVLWLVHRNLRAVREDCCDDLLLAREVVSNDAYCDVLLRAASNLCAPLALSASLGFGESIHPLGRRLARITDWNLQRAEGVSALGAIAVLISAAMLFPGVRPREVMAEAEAPGSVVPAHTAMPPKLTSVQVAPGLRAVPTVTRAGMDGAVALANRQRAARQPLAQPYADRHLSVSPPVRQISSEGRARQRAGSEAQPGAKPASWTSSGAAALGAQARAMGATSVTEPVHGWGYYRPPTIGIITANGPQPPARLVTRVWTGAILLKSGDFVGLRHRTPKAVAPSSVFGVR